MGITLELAQHCSCEDEMRGCERKKKGKKALSSVAAYSNHRIETVVAILVSLASRQWCWVCFHFHVLFAFST